ncbi:hypothetical protein D3C74_441480 [compost metagenome]
MPVDLEELTVQRIVVRNGLSRDLAASLLGDIRTEIAFLDALESPMPVEAVSKGFHH